MTRECKSCNPEAEASDSPDGFFKCVTCDRVFSVNHVGGEVSLQNFLARLSLGDDNALAAVSRPHVSSIRGFVESTELAGHMQRRAEDELVGQLRSMCLKAENRIDYALSALTGLDMGIPGMDGILDALREARELVSPMSHRTHGVEEVDNAASG